MKNRRLYIWLLAIAVCSPLIAEDDPIAKIGWKKIEDVASFKPVKVDTGSQKPILLLELKDPKITEQNHAIGGEIRYTNVAGAGFMEMWTHYENGGQYFSRTLGDVGPMAKLAGDSEWRPFLLPFFGDPKKRPVKLQVNVILPGGGEVEFRNVGLYQLKGDRTKTVAALNGGWWGESFAAKFGAIGGTAIGFFGMLCGILCWLGKGRLFVTTTMLVAGISGALSSIACIVAAFSEQPYEVWYPLLLFGVILLISGGVGYPWCRKLYLNHELRAISAAG